MTASMFKRFSLSVAFTLILLAPAQAREARTANGHDEQQLAETPPITWQSTPIDVEPNCTATIATYTITLKGDRMTVTANNERGFPQSDLGMIRPYDVDLDPRKGVLENGYLVFRSHPNQSGHIQIIYFEPSELKRGNVPKTFRRRRDDRPCFQLYKPN